MPRKTIKEVLDDATKDYLMMPHYMRPETKRNAFDEVRSICWDLTEEQREQVAKYARSLLNE